jgi:hypothetical protein
MDLTQQPPRRPSNIRVLGIVNLARMADKARAHEDETEGEFLYGEVSKLDKILLDFLGVSADDFADAADRYGDEELAGWTGRVSEVSDADIEAFNTHHLAREPDDDAGRGRLRDRVERYAPNRTDIRTVFQSIELDDWASFREVDLSVRAPRTPYNRGVFGVYGLSRMADKARAERCGKLGEYIYNCPIDEAIMAFLDLTSDGLGDAAWENPNDLELGEWVAANSSRTSGEVLAFNARISNKGPESEREREIFQSGLQRSAPGRTDVVTWFGLLDLDDEASFETVDLTRRSPRSPYDTSVGGIAGLARMIDKGRAYLGGTLSDYWYGEDSGVDRFVLKFLGMSAEAFTDALGICKTDGEVVSWLGEKADLTETKIQQYNDDAFNLGPSSEDSMVWLRGVIATLDSSRTDIDTYFGLMQLSDKVSFERLKAGV